MYFLYPVEDCLITSYFNDYRDYSKIAPKKKQLHEGIDFAPRNPKTVVPVFSSRDGTVLEIGFQAKGYGYYIVIKHSDRFFTWYAHLESKPQFKIGAEVKAETFLANMGSTGFSTGKHLHYNVQDLVKGLNGYVVPKVVDPYPLLVDKIDSLQIPIQVYNIISN